MSKRIGDLTVATSIAATDNLEVSLANSTGSRKVTLLTLVVAIAALFGFYALQASEDPAKVLSKLYPFGHIQRYGAACDGVTNDTAAVQRAHDCLPSTGGKIVFPPGFTLFSSDGTYVNITKPNVSLIGDSASWVTAPNSADAEVRTGTRTLTGFIVTGDNCTVSVNMRGPSIGWTAQSATERLTVRDMTMKNLYVGGIGVANVAADRLYLKSVVFDTSRDLASDVGNYEMVTRSSAAADPQLRLLLVDGCVFRSVAGGLDCHNTRHTVVTGGTRFEGCDIGAIKLSTADALLAEMNLVVDESVTFDGAPVNAASLNRHVNCAVNAADRTTQGAFEIAFIQVFSNIQWHARSENFPNNGITFLDGSYINAVLNFDRSRFAACPNAIFDAQGTISMCDMHLTGSNILWSAVGTVRRMTFKRNRMIDSYVNFTKNSVENCSITRCEENDVSWSLNNSGPIRFTNYGTDNGMFLLVDNNRIAITGGGNTRVADLSTTGTLGIWLPGNRISAVAGTPVINGGMFPAAYEPTTVAGTTSLFLFGLHHGEVTLTNPNAAGNIAYDVRDAALNAEIGTTFDVFREHATNSIAVLATTMKGSPGSGTVATATAQYSSARFKKVAAGSWRMFANTGSWTVA